MVPSDAIEGSATLGQGRWQDLVFDLAGSIRERAASQGFFGVNMASTGCGKTLANGRILYALSNPRQGARFNIALGLRGLTLQTGDAYRELLGSYVFPSKVLQSDYFQFLIEY